MKKNKTAAAANNIHTHPLKGGGVIFAACSRRQDQGQKPRKKRPRDSRSTDAKPSEGGSHAAPPTPRLEAEKAPQDAESRKQYSDPRTANYVSAYADWTAGMSDADLAKLAALGLDKPLVDDHHATGTGLDGDMAESAAASYTPDIIAQVEPETQANDQGPFDSEALWDALRRMLGELLNQKNAKLTLECFALVSGASFLGDSMTAIARRHGMTRAAVSKRCIDIARELNLPPSRSMRAATARQSYRQAQLKHNAKTNR